MDTLEDSPASFVDGILRNPTRREILRLLQASPGLNPHQIAAALGAHGSTVEFHVGRLESAGLVVRRAGAVGRETICFAAENAVLWENEKTRVLFGRSPSRDVATFIAENSGASTAEVAKALKISEQSVRRHIRTLEERGLVRRLRLETGTIYHGEPDLLEWVAQLGELQSRAPHGP